MYIGISSSQHTYVYTMTEPTRQEAIYTAIAHIPEGKVATYGQIAKLAGFPRGARLVGQALKQLPAKSTIPWHRVINAQGQLSFPKASAKYHEQYARLQAEDVAFNGGKINLTLFQWDI